MTDNYGTYAENTWCTGCGNFGILTAFKRALKTLGENGIDKDKLLITSGIGQHGKIFDYLSLSGFYSLHGRSMATAQGIKLAKPELKVIDFVGDGDALGEGIEHLIFAAKRNADITVVLHDNGVYGLTTGQFSPRSEMGYRGPSTPYGNVEEPLAPLSLMLEAGATFIARGYSARIDNLSELIVKGVMHEGFSFIDVLQPCVAYNNTYSLYNKITEVMDGENSDYDEAIKISKDKEKIKLGVVYRDSNSGRAPYHKRILLPERQSREKRIETLNSILSAL
ncbi:MAG: thiamine pyrophosphate-dependent enzyme [Candidatus Thermoplasmatota archaeon]|nr:thiamine pyrophosphate-dependent enzyme [Candidatus Thermoplasmatota archaeon]